MKTNGLFKKLTSVFIVACLLLLTGLGLFGILNKNSLQSMAANEISISNAQFTDFNSTTGAPRYFTSSSSVDNTNVKAGVIDVSKPNYKKYNFGRKDDNVLRISTDEQDDNTTSEGKPHSIYFGYDTSSSINLEAGKNYKISAEVFTNTSAGIGTMYLKDGSNDDKILSKISNISSYGGWSSFYFLVKTDDINSLNVKLGLYLNGAGTILFDDLHCTEISDAKLKDELENEGSNYEYLSQYKVIKEISPESSPFILKNIAENSNAEYVYVTLNDEGYDGFNTTLKIKNEKAAINEFETSDNLFVENPSEVTAKNLIEQNSIYKITIRAKAVKVSNNAYFKLVETNSNKTSDALTFTGTSDYQNYSFYVKTYAESGKINLKLLVGLGEEDAASTGTIYVSKITLSKLSFSTYESSTSGSQIMKFDLVETTDTTDLIDNGAFNDVQPDNLDKLYPITPSKWTVDSIDETGHLYGVVNTSNAEFEKLKSTNKGITFVNPYLSDVNNNVLMMYASSNSPLTYTSTSKNLSNQTSNTFSMKVQCISMFNNANDNFKVELIYKKDSEDIVLATTSIAPSTDVGSFKVVKFNLDTAYQNLDVYIKLTLNSTSGAFAFVDDVKYFNSDKSMSADIAVKADLKNTFDYSDNKVGDYYEAKNFSKTIGTGSYSGIINLNESIAAHVADMDYLTELKGLSAVFAQEDIDAGFEHSNNVFAFRNDYNFSSNNYYSTNLGYRLDANKYYKLVVYVFTNNLIKSSSQEDENVGVCLGMTGFSKSFSKIKTDNSWQRYVFYINPTNSVDASCLQVGLGTTESQCIGKAFIGDICFKEIEEDEFVSTDSSKTLVLQQVTQTEDDDTTEDATNEETNTSNAGAWLYAAPSIIFALAIIICVVGVIVRKTKWKKPVKKSKNDYDRNKTVSKQYYARKANAVKEERLRKLNKELEKLTNERTQYEEEYKHDLTKLRELKIKRAPQTDIVKLEKDMKKNQRLSSALGVNINNLNDEISYTKSEQYYSQLIKKLMSEPAPSDNAKENDSETEQQENDNKK